MNKMNAEKMCAVILAAGTSSRMGELKQLLPLNGKPLLEHVIRQALDNGFTDIFTVVGHEAERIRANITITDERHHWLINEEYAYGQSTSVKKALMHIKGDYPHAMILLGDLPFIKNDTVEKVRLSGAGLCSTHKAPFLVRPVHLGEAGHPVFIGNITTQLVEHLEGDAGFKSIKNHFAMVELIETDDDGVNFDLDTSEDYKIASEKSRR